MGYVAWHERLATVVVSRPKRVGVAMVSVCHFWDTMMEFDRRNCEEMVDVDVREKSCM